MANTITVTSVDRGTKQFQGAFKEMFFISGTVADQDGIANGNSSVFTITVNGVQLGDMYIGHSFSVSQAETDSQVEVEAWVHAANTIRIKLTNVDASTDTFNADTLNGSTVKLCFGRPNW